MNHQLRGRIAVSSSSVTKILTFSSGQVRLFGGQRPRLVPNNRLKVHYQIKGVPVRALFRSWLQFDTNDDIDDGYNTQKISTSQSNH